MLEFSLESVEHIEDVPQQIVNQFIYKLIYLDEKSTSDIHTRLNIKKGSILIDNPPEELGNFAITFVDNQYKFWLVNGSKYLAISVSKNEVDNV